MEDKNKISLLKYMKEHNIIRKYQIIFDKLFKYEALELITDVEVSELICKNEYESIVRLYEIINNDKINEDIKKYILSLDKPEVIRYCLRLATSKEFNDDEKKKQYIYALSESSEDIVRYVYGIASSKAYIEKENGILFVKEFSCIDKNLAFNLVNFVHSKYFINDKDSLKFIKYLKKIEDEFIIEYMMCLVESEDFSKERMSLENIIKLLQDKHNEKVMIKK